MSARYPEENMDIGIRGGSWCQHIMRGKEVQPARAAAAAVLPAGPRWRGRAARVTKQHRGAAPANSVLPRLTVSHSSS